MTQHSLTLIEHSRDCVAKAAGAAGARHPLDRLDAARVAKHLVIFRPDGTVLDCLLAEARRSIPKLASTQVVARVLAHNPDCFWAFARRRNFAAQAPVGEGFAAMLPLTKAGLEELAKGSFDGSNPDLTLVARPGEKPAGIYFWALFAPGALSGGLALFMEKLATPLYRDVDIFSCPNTLAGHKFNQASGLTRDVVIDGVIAPQLYVFRRSLAPAQQVKYNAPLYDSHRDNSGASDLTVAVARSFDDLMQVASIRSAVYIAEQRCPYREEFDGNDLASTHLLGFVGDEPSGCLRIRYFADFAKIERLAVRQEFRHTRLAFHIVRAGVELCRMKGYRLLYGHSQKRLLKFWSRFGFRPLEGREGFAFSDFDYVEIVADIDRHPDAIAIGLDPYVMIRPEGQWHMPGILERSSARPVTRPSVDEARG
jgi:predicted GNAT family N-acyltransferase